jgi:hypothetical protein
LYVFVFAILFLLAHAIVNHFVALATNLDHVLVVATVATGLVALGIALGAVKIVFGVSYGRDRRGYPCFPQLLLKPLLCFVVNHELSITF